ncbi:hypothetical protein Q0590_08705 [Rhodocytophaga aerolata]|uniref:DUF1328 domain-containing protein n=1 Tax=Rhodocytophaga aerolata TaxID=455078 RepID=A0ABT8R2K8_9BACT|nr:hypothetical protein [Rhodocytophaga aerolata]MDO1446328.1 hypothetical protein [Rhodocytophaga aerolata]
MNPKLLALFGFSIAMFFFGIEALSDGLLKVAAIEFAIAIITLLLFFYLKSASRKKIV